MSYILPKVDKPRIEAAARNMSDRHKRRCSMSDVITDALVKAGVLGSLGQVTRSAEDGRFVTKAAAKANPKTTVRQTVHRKV